MLDVVKSSSHLQEIDTESLFLSSIVSYKLSGGRYQAHVRREGIEYSGVTPHNEAQNAIEEGRLVACQWYCYEQFAACAIVDISSRNLVAVNEKAIALLNQQKGDRFVAFRSKDRNCLFVKNRLIKMAIGEELETSYQKINFIAKKLTVKLFAVLFLEEYYLE